MTACTHTTKHARSFYGFWDGLRATDYFASCLRYAPFLSLEQRDLAKRVSSSANKMHNAFSIPQTIYNAGVLTSCVDEVFEKGLTRETGKRIGVAVVYFSNSLTQSLLFLKQMKFLQVVGATVIDAIYGVTNLLMDAKDLYETDGKNSTAWMDFLKLVRTISSLASGVLALGAIVFVALQTEAVVIASLVLSVVWITTKITVKLWQEMRDAPTYSFRQEKL